jgi:type II secretory pathway component PulC
VNGDVIFSIAGAAVRDASDLKPLWNEKAVSIRGQRNEKMLDIILPQINYVSEKYESKNEPQRIAKETLKSLSNLDQISSSTKAVPYYKNGEAIGVRLFAMQDQSPLKVIGLQSGDIVIAIGDSHVVDPESYFQKLLQALHQSHPTELQLERDRERLTIILE